MLLLDVPDGMVYQLRMDPNFTKHKITIVNDDTKQVKVMKKQFEGYPNVTVVCKDFFNVVNNSRKRFDIVWFDSTSSPVTLANKDVVDKLARKTNQVLSITFTPPRGPSATSFRTDDDLSPNDNGMNAFKRIINTHSELQFLYQMTYLGNSPGKSNTRMNWIVMKVLRTEPPVTQRRASKRLAGLHSPQTAERPRRSKEPATLSKGVPKRRLISKRTSPRLEVAKAPRASPRLAKTTRATKALGAACYAACHPMPLGARVEVLFDTQKARRGTWYAGRVATHDVALQECLVKYDDHTHGRLDLTDPALWTYVRPT